MARLSFFCFFLSIKFPIDLGEDEIVVDFSQSRLNVRIVSITVLFDDLAEEEDIKMHNSWENYIPL